MPQGYDGITLEYRLSGGARDVRDGKVRVEITFYTASKNYTPPSAQYAYVEILPIEITVEWSDLKFTYSGAFYSPSAKTPPSVKFMLYGVNTCYFHQIV